MATPNLEPVIPEVSIQTGHGYYLLDSTYGTGSILLDNAGRIILRILSRIYCLFALLK